MITPQIVNRKTVETLLGECSDELYDYIQGGTDLDTTIGYDPKGKFYYYFEEGRRGLQFGNDAVFRVLMIEQGSKTQIGAVGLSVPFAVLCDTVTDFWVYRIFFSPASAAAEQLMSHHSFNAFRLSKGYVGMTGRTRPTDRLREHLYNVRSGGGHLLHKAWRSLGNVTDIISVFHLVGCFNSREDALNAEEMLVDRIGTIAPHGLNVIAGGMKGIREMWRLGIMSKNGKPTDDQKDAALELLESERNPVATHYRTGHIRRLPAKCKVETTWVSPCWVGMKEALV